jgi:hypothetical protein
MFILRRISSQGIEMNQEVGDEYTYINKYLNYDEFCKCFEKYFKKPHVADLNQIVDFDTEHVYAFVCHIDFVQPLYDNQFNYMMTGEGNTFCNLSERFS